METAGSLRIETFEGSRSRLRRTREGYGCSIHGKDRGMTNLYRPMVPVMAFDTISR